MKNMLAVVGLVVALAGLGVAVFQDEIRDEQKSSVQSVTQDALDIGKEVWSGEKRLRDDAISIIYIILGLIGLVLGLAALLKKESGGLSLLAMAAGGTAMTWHWLVGIFS
jgi:hypothetical protein